MTPCKGTPCKGCYYTGKENNPRGRGFCAKHEKEGMEMKGKDRKMYIVKGNRWVLSGEKKTSPRMSYSQENPLTSVESLLTLDNGGDEDELEIQIGDVYDGMTVVGLFNFKDKRCHLTTYIIVCREPDNNRLVPVVGEWPKSEQDIQTGKCGDSLRDLKEYMRNSIDKVEKAAYKSIINIYESYVYVGQKPFEIEWEDEK